MSFQPFADAVSLTGQTGNIVTTAIFSAPVKSRYAITVYASPSAAVALSAMTLTIGWTEDGVARTRAFASLSLASLTATMDNYMQVRADAGTNVTYQVSALGLGGYNLLLSWKIFGT